jgi:type II secretory pathway component PulL
MQPQAAEARNVLFMGSDRITIIRGKNNGTLDWRACRRGQSAVLAEGSLESGSETLPADVSGKRAGSVTLALPASQIVTRIMQFPVLDAEELAGAVALQVDKFSPFPVEQMVYSYEELGKHGDACTVLMAIAQRTSVAGWGDALRRSGTEISRVDCAALSACGRRWSVAVALMCIVGKACWWWMPTRWF